MMTNDKNDQTPLNIWRVTIPDQIKDPGVIEYDARQEGAVVSTRRGPNKWITIVYPTKTIDYSWSADGESVRHVRRRTRRFSPLGYEEEILETTHLTPVLFTYGAALAVLERAGIAVKDTTPEKTDDDN